MKIAVLGAAGQLGRDLCPRLDGDVVPLGREQIDLASSANLGPALKQIRPDVFINCAAYNFVDKAESEPDAAFAVNAWGVRELATVCRDIDCVLVHFSSDYVFGLDVNRSVPYAETDAPGPVSVYGLSKLAGEYLVRSICPRHFVIRTCGLYGVWGAGGKGGNFVETMLRLAGQGKPLRVVGDQICTPSYTVDVATATTALLSSNQFGLYHIVNTGSCTWHEFARTIFEMTGVSAALTAITSAEFGAKAQRPGYSVLATEKYQSLGLPTLRHSRQALAAYLTERQAKERKK
jgi:dTDP-4-dehydrorhamnose reductase